MSFDNADIFMVADAEIRDRGLVAHHISSMNDLYDTGIPQIVTQIFLIDRTIENHRTDTEEDREIQTIKVEVRFSDVRMTRPTTVHVESGKEIPLYPKTALLMDKTYSAALRVDVSIKATAFYKNGMSKVRKDIVRDLKLCKVPVMIRSKMCHTYGLPRDALVGIDEDPSDEGGYFIIRGVEWSILCTENVLFNEIRIFPKESYMKEMYRAEFISRPGDTYQNSGEVIVRWLKTDCITVEIVRDKLTQVQLPFYVVFRALGWTNDADVFENIIWSDTPGQRSASDIDTKMFGYIRDAYAADYDRVSGARNVYDSVQAVRAIVDELKADDTGFKYLDLDENPGSYQIAINTILHTFDSWFLPHIGKLPENRTTKLRYLALIIRKIFLVKLGILQPTDRDSYKSKRIFPAGVSYAKAFKTYFRASNIQQINKQLSHVFKTMSFSQINLAQIIRASVQGGVFERLMTQSITAGTKTQLTLSQRQKTVNRLVSEQLSRKNQLSMLSSLRQVVATNTDSSKQSDRANDMRRVHPSFIGYICLIHSAEGEAAGINKQIACTATICKASSSILLKQILQDDTDMVPLAKLKPWQLNTLQNVYVNGDWMGAVNDSVAFVRKYRMLRRACKINTMTTIYHDPTQDEIFFWTDVGRMIRPLIIVYNSKRDAEFLKGRQLAPLPPRAADDDAKRAPKDDFWQGTLLTQEIIDKLHSEELGINDLLKRQIVEYITADELDNCYLCSSYSKLRAEAHDELHEYTHLEIPEAQIGLTAMITPYSDHNQTLRITFESMQARQACGCFALNWPFRSDKHTFLQYKVEAPALYTIANRYLHPNGTNIMVAVMINSGFNQEDSIIINKGAFERGLFDGCTFKFERAELEQKEEFGVPNFATTSGIKSANYEKLDQNGFAHIGSVIEKGDAIIGKYMKVTHAPGSESQYTHIDCSVIYKEDEQAIVHNVITGKNEDNERFVKIVLRKLRPTIIGDKFCLTPDHEVLTVGGWKPIAEVTHQDLVATLNPDTQSFEYQYPNEVYNFDHTGPMYHVHTKNVDLMATPEHKMYVRQCESGKPYELVPVTYLANRRVRYKCNAKNTNPESSALGIDMCADADAWIELVGFYAMYGHIAPGTQALRFEYTASTMQRIVDLCDRLKVRRGLDARGQYVCVNDATIAEYMRHLGHRYNRSLPAWVAQLSQRQAEVMLRAFGDRIEVVSKYLADSIQIVALLAEYTAHVRYDFQTVLEDALKRPGPYSPNKCYIVEIGTHGTQLEPPVGGVRTNELRCSHYDGQVYCIGVPHHVFMVRRNGKPVWTGNSSRSGQKGIVALKMKMSDMPFDENGIAPAIIFNPHGFPSRMTIAQMFEQLVALVCAHKGATTDASIFRPINEDAVQRDLEDIIKTTELAREQRDFHTYGFDAKGTTKLYNGITGEAIDARIYMGPVYYQRLQKFVSAQNYCVPKGPVNSLTRQPLDGRASTGGLKIGVMEAWTLSGHGTMRFLREKLYDHSDKFMVYICRTCGRDAIVNHDAKLYSCKRCKDNADICAVNSGYANKLYAQELDAMNVGVRRVLEPATYERYSE